MMKCIDTLSEKDLRGKRVLLRSDFNVPLSAAGEVANAFRVERGWATVRYLSERGAKVIAVSHMGKSEESLAPVGRALKRFGPIVFIPDIVGHVAKDAAAAMKEGEIALSVLTPLKRPVWPEERATSGARRPTPACPRRARTS